MAAGSTGAIQDQRKPFLKPGRIGLSLFRPRPRGIPCVPGKPSLSTRQKKRNPLSGMLIPAVSLAILAYFGYHAQTGRYSIHTQKEMDQEAMRLEFRLAGIRHQRETLESRIRLVTDGSIEQDQLDELARSVLGMSGENELIILR